MNQVKPGQIGKTWQAEIKYGQNAVNTENKSGVKTGDIVVLLIRLAHFTRVIEGSAEGAPEQDDRWHYRHRSCLNLTLDELGLGLGLGLGLVLFCYFSGSLRELGYFLLRTIY